ncbi:MAG: prolipoprotein diacylglyceryl transferase [Ruminococcus sp.]|nr:prolipoprotein diacylglyceryl transferase [Ruminococcus sp.]
MLPYFDIFGIKLSSYAFFSLVGILTSGFFVCRMAKKRGHDDNDYIIFMLISAIGVFAGGHLLYGVTQFRAFWEVVTHLGKYITGFKDFIAIFSYIFGGSVFYGGLLGGIAAGIIYGKAKKLDLIEYSDIIAPMVPLFHCFGRIGCFFGGCCYGIECHGCGITIHGNTVNPSINDVERFPVQLLEAALNLGLFFLLYYLLRKNRLKGGLFSLYLGLYSIVRFCDEFLRGDAYRGFLFGLSTSQLISIIIFIYALIFFAVYFARRKKNISEL